MGFLSNSTYTFGIMYTMSRVRRLYLFECEKCEKSAQALPFTTLLKLFEQLGLR